MRLPALLRIARSLLLASASLLTLSLLSACVTRTVRTVDMTPQTEALAPPPGNTALALGIAVFETNVPKNYETAQAQGISKDIRAAEANYFPYVLKSVLSRSGYWSTVRVVPRLSNAVDVTILGRIEESDGEHLRLNIGVVDASGEIWFRRDYDASASRYAYDPSIPTDMDPFQNLYQKIGTDLIAHYEAMSTKQVVKLRRIARLRFAQQMAPEAFADYLLVQPNGRVEARRLPADDDPMNGRIEKVRQREFSFIDALDQHYQHFYGTMNPLYLNYRKSTYEHSVQLRRLREEARTRTLIGAAAVIGGLAMATQSHTSGGQTAGAIGVLSGAGVLRTGFTKRADSRLHADQLTELATSMSTEISPHTIALESESITLTGTVDEQYKTLRQVLSRAYRSDLGLPAVGTQQLDSTLTIDALRPNAADDATDDDATDAEPNAP